MCDDISLRFCTCASVIWNVSWCAVHLYAVLTILIIDNYQQCDQYKVLCCWHQKSASPLCVLSWLWCQTVAGQVASKLSGCLFSCLQLNVFTCLHKSCFFLVAEMENWLSWGIIWGLPHFFSHMVASILPHGLNPILSLYLITRQGSFAAAVLCWQYLMW